MEKDDEGSTMIRMGVSGWMFLLVPAYLGCPGSKAVKRSLLLLLLLSVLWHCWLGIRKSIWPVEIEWWGVGVVICLEPWTDCLHMVQLMPLHPKTPSSLALFKSRLVLPFWYQLSQVVLEKRPLNGCSSSSSLLCFVYCSLFSDSWLAF